MREFVDAYMVAIVVAAPAALWTLYELAAMAIRATREWLVARRIIRNTWGDGLP